MRAQRVLLAPARALLWLAVGGVVGLCTVVLSPLWWGLALGVLATLALARAVPPGWSGRVPLALGWAVVVLRLALRRPEGDYLLGSDPAGYVVLALGVALVVGALVTVPVRRAGPPGS